MAIIFLALVIASIISSYLIYREVQGMQVGPDRIERTLFMRQYEYELLRTSTVFAETYPTPINADSQQSFNNWFNVLWSRVESMNEGKMGLDAIDDGFNYEHLQQSMIEIDRLLYKRSLVTKGNIELIRKLFKRLVRISQNFHQKRNSLYREISLQRQINFFTYFSSNFVLHMLTLISGFFVALYLISTNKTLLELGVKLEERVKERTQALSISNNKLTEEIGERRLTEQRLLESQAQIKDAKDRAENQVNFDSLTALASRTLFSERFLQALDRSDRMSTQVALVFLDLDRFKYINDTLGHSAGDELLQMTAARINKELREGDTAARFGGDEFAVILPDIKNMAYIEHIIDRIRQRLGKPYNLSGNSVIVSASIGITVFPKDGENAEILLRKADRAMYKAKEKGRNNFQFFTQEMDDEAHARLSLETDLYTAVKQDEFKMYYQSIVDSVSGQVTGAEALIRWPHKTRGFVSPELFIPAAEEIDLIFKIGEWALYTACRDAARWQGVAGKPITISVNMSSKQFQKQDIVALVKKVLQETGLAAQCLVLEITERLIMGDSQATLLQLKELRVLGVKLAIDDFGTGYSSLSYLNKFPISILKIDRSFMQNVTEDSSSAELVRAIISMASSLKLRVIAEGVETSEQVQFLIENNGTCCQGYFFNKPSALNDFEDTLEHVNKSELVQKNTSYNSVNLAFSKQQHPIIIDATTKD